MAKRFSLPPVAPCEAPGCDDGTIQGIFSRSPCAACNGVGYVVDGTGESVPSDEALAALKYELKRVRGQRDVLKAEVLRLRELAGDDGVDRYRGMSKRLGGNYRMD